MSLLRRMMRARGKKDRKDAPDVGVAEASAPLVPAAAGRPEGFLCNANQVVIARSVEWEIIIHPAIKEYTVRVKGTPEDHVCFNFDVVAELTMEFGVKWNPRTDKPPTGGALLCKGKDGTSWYLTLDRFINEVLARVDKAMAERDSAEVAKDLAQQAEDLAVERAVLDDEKAEDENKQP